MIDNFTFIVLTYNHEKYVVRNLNSIKAIVCTYGKNIKNNLIVADDCSKDNTVDIAREWISDNKEIFYDTQILCNSQNKGTVKNIINAVNKTKTKQFKFIGGDDLFLNQNIYSLYDDITNKIIITPLVLTGNNIKNQQICFEKDYILLEYCIVKNKIKKLIKIDNFIKAPGVFFDCNYFNDKKFILFLSKFRNIEDYPMWYYFIINNSARVEFRWEYYVLYTIGTGISTSGSMSSDEVDKMYDILNSKMHKYNRIINPYWYLVKMWRIKSRLHYYFTKSKV